MNTTILIPTDFTVASLQLIEYAVVNYPDTKLNIKLVAGYKLPDTRWGVIRFNSREQLRKQLTEGFDKATRRLVLQNKDSIKELSFEVFTGVNALAFENFLEQVKAENAIVPEKGTLKCSSTKWFDVTCFIRKTVKNVIEVSVEIAPEVEPRHQFISLFNL